MRLLTALALSLALLAVTMLEREKTGLTVTRLDVAGSPVTLWREVEEGPRPLVVVAHGFAGSRQMMRAYAIALARSGFEVATLDLPGHGRHPRPMTGDVTQLEGATAMLTRELIAVTRALRADRETAGGLALLGHSMATDIVIRAGEVLDPDAVVAISMYSEAVTQQSPAALLILSGAQERRLRTVALDALRLVDPDAEEGETATLSDVTRRAVAAPWVGHVGVLYSPLALREARDWIAGALGQPVRGMPPLTALWLVVLLGALVALARPLAAPFGPPQQAARCPRRLAGLALLAPILPAVAVTALMPDLGGVMAFAPLAGFFAVWGGVQHAILIRGGRRLPPPSPWAAGALTVWAIGLFALALDRYGAAFLPSGPRLPLALMLLPPAWLFLRADALLTQGGGLLLRIAARILPLLAILGAMMLDPLLGVAFTVLPVVLLFWLVFGTAARWMAARTGAGTTAPVLALMLAWSIAASTPLIAP